MKNTTHQSEKDFHILADFFPVKPERKLRLKKFKTFPCPGFADGLEEFSDALNREHGSE
jgi:hypothetical protein